jgi:hypothetical protein
MKGEAPLVSDCDVVEVGREYMVPCVTRLPRWVNGPGLDNDEHIVPVLGPAHEDADIIKFPEEHWHYDLRFLAPEIIDGLMAEVERVHGKKLGIEPVYDDIPPLPRIKKKLRPRYAMLAVIPYLNAAEPFKTSLRRLRCLRKMPDYPSRIGNTLLPFVRELENAYAQHRKRDCRTCPHRGTPLNGLPIRDGVVTCPGHGLRFKVSTGELVRVK